MLPGNDRQFVGAGTHPQLPWHCLIWIKAAVGTSSSLEAGSGPDAANHPITRSKRVLPCPLQATTGAEGRAAGAWIFAFLFLTAVLMPAFAVATVGSYGLAVWVYQMLAGPPGPPVR
jgi:nitrate reductase NapE